MYPHPLTPLSTLHTDPLEQSLTPKGTKVAFYKRIPLIWYQEKKKEEEEVGGKKKEVPRGIPKPISNLPGQNNQQNDIDKKKKKLKKGE